MIQALFVESNSIKKQTVIKRFVSLRLLVVNALQRSRILVQIGKQM